MGKGSIYAGMKAIGFRAKNAAELRATLDQIYQENPTVNLCILFASVHTHLAEWTPVLDNYPFEIFGASSGGEILTASEGPSISHSSIAGLLLDMPEGHFKVRLFATPDGDSHRVAGEIAHWAMQEFPHPALFLMSAGLRADGDALVHGLESSFPFKVPIYGAFAADDMEFQGTAVFDGRELCQEGVIACVLDLDRIEAHGVAIHGWKEIGDSHIVTRSEGNRVYEIDGRSALQLYREYAGIEGQKDLATALEFPLQVIRKNGTRVLRAIIAIHEDGSLVFNGNVPQDSTVYLSSPPGASVVDATIRELESFHEISSKAHAGILFHCAVRHHALGDEVEREIQTACQLWGIPVTGVFSYGEIGELKGSGCDFHAATYSLFLMYDKESPVHVNGYGKNFITTREYRLQHLENFDEKIGTLKMAKSISRVELMEILNEFQTIKDEYKDVIGTSDRLAHHHHTKSSLLTKTSADLQTKIRKIESLNQDLEETYQLVQKERHKSDQLLKNVLPQEIAVRIKLGETRIAERKRGVTILFADLVGFTELAGRYEAEKVVDMLGVVFSEMDRLADHYQLEKIKTIGDCYMAACMENEGYHVLDFALSLLDQIPELNRKVGLDQDLQFRIGIHAGDVVAGVIGEKRFLYDLWGDTVNTASRMESHGEAGKIHCTQEVSRQWRDRYLFLDRGMIQVKGKGMLRTFFVERK